MKRTISVLLTLLLLLFCATTCFAQDQYLVAMIPKYTGINYFNATEQGAKEAAAELGIDLIYDGPTEASVSKQIEMIDTWITMGVDAILVSPNDPDAIADILNKAREAGILVMTWDSDANVDARDYFVNQASEKAIGAKLVDLMIADTHDAAKVAIVTESLTDANQNAWVDGIRARIAELGVAMDIVTILPCDGDQMKAYEVTKDIVKAYPGLDGIWGISSTAGPGVASAIRDLGLSGKIVVGAVATPSTIVEYLEDGTMLDNVLWNPIDLGYLAVYAAHEYLSGNITEQTKEMNGGRLGMKEIEGTQILLGEPTVFTLENIYDFNF